MRQRLTLEQKVELRQRLSAQRLRLATLLEMSALEFQRRVRDELENNPAIGTDELEQSENTADDEMSVSQNEQEYQPQYTKFSGTANYENDFQPQIPDKTQGMQTDLLQQIEMLPINDRKRQLCAYLAGMLDGDGYMRRNIENIVDDLLFNFNIETDPKELEIALQILQMLEPAGIGARTLKECLLLQLRRKPSGNSDIALAAEIMEHRFLDFAYKKYSDIMTKMKITREALDAAAVIIRRLNPKPGAALASDAEDAIPAIVPDFVVENKCGELVITLAPRHLPKLHLNKRYSALAENAHRDARQFAAQKNKDAAQFISDVQRRANMLELIINAIVGRQRNFFLTGIETDLNPMTQSAVAHQTGCSKSTISRCVSNKYVQTNFGTFLLNYFFVNQVKTSNGNVLSIQHLRSAIAEIVENENKRHPLTDIKIQRLLHKCGIEVSLRTTTKYREEMGIDNSRNRRQV